MNNKKYYPALLAIISGTVTLASCAAPAPVAPSGAPAPTLNPAQPVSGAAPSKATADLDWSAVMDSGHKADLQDYIRFNDLHADTVFSEGALFVNSDTPGQSYEVLSGDCGTWAPEFHVDCVKYKVFNGRVVLHRHCSDDPPMRWIPGPCPSAPPPVTPTPVPQPAPSQPADNSSNGGVGGAGGPGGSGSSPFPSATPAPKGILWLSADRYFSPNQEPDGRKDRNRIYIHADPAWGEWTLSVAGRTGEIARGNGHRHRFEWDGRVNNAALPDGKYTLVLKATEAPQQTVEVVLDTTAPQFSLTIGKARVSSSNKIEEPIEDVNPLIELDFDFDLSGIKGVEEIETAFSKRPDGGIPAVQEQNESFEWKSTGTGSYKYQVPFEPDAILFPGTQQLGLTVEDRSGNVAERTAEFAVGGKTSEVFSGGIGPKDPRSAYRGLIFPDNYTYQQEYQEKLRTLRERYPAPQYQVKEIDPNSFLSFIVSKPFAQSPETAKLVNLASRMASTNGGNIFSVGLPIFAVVSGATAGVVLWSYADEEMKNLSQLVENAQQLRYKVDIGKVGDKQLGRIDVNKDTWHHMHVEKNHHEINSTNLLECLYHLKQKSRSIEVWQNPSPTQPGVSGVVGSVTRDFLLLAEIGNQIFFIVIHNKPGGEENFVRTGYIPRFNNATNKTSSLTEQWKYIGTKVAEYYRLKPDGDKDEKAAAEKYFNTSVLDWTLRDGTVVHLSGKVASSQFLGSNPYYSPDLEYPDWIFGEIADRSKTKTYYINKSQRRAIALEDRGL